jgi:hypothetical protein
MPEHHEQAQELGQAVERALTLRERLERDFDALERSLARMRETMRELPPDDHPGRSVPVELDEPEGIDG